MYIEYFYQLSGQDQFEVIRCISMHFKVPRILKPYIKLRRAFRSYVTIKHRKPYTGSPTCFCRRFVTILLLLVNFEIGFGVRRYLNEPEVASAVQMLEDGVTQRTVAERLGVSRSVVARLWIRFQESGRYRRRPGQGHGRATIAREDRYLQNMACRNQSTNNPSVRQSVNQSRQSVGLSVNQSINQSINKSINQSSLFN